jgi:hypothetical protein
MHHPHCGASQHEGAHQSRAHVGPMNMCSSILRRTACMGAKWRSKTFRKRCQRRKSMRMAVPAINDADVSMLVPMDSVHAPHRAHLTLQASCLHPTHPMCRQPVLEPSRPDCGCTLGARPYGALRDQPRHIRTREDSGVSNGGRHGSHACKQPSKHVHACAKAPGVTSPGSPEWLA